jgi:NAD(P)-dependent dehydrogenase (short-subunit alcohol dehydrogenase family)
MRLAHKTAVITGAGSGMGKAMAELFVREGANVLLADLSGDQDVVAASLGGAAVAVHCDVAQEDQVQVMIATAEQRFGKLDILCNNAGFGGGLAPLADQTTETWDRVHAVNIRGVFLGMKYGIQSMLKTGGGSIVNTGSASGIVGWKGHSIYGGAKAGMHQMSRAAALDYAAVGIRVNVVAPGTMWTGLVPQSRDVPEPPADGFRLAGIPMDRWGTAMDIATAALFLASDEASYITGVILPVDGGYCIGFSGMGAEHNGLPGSATERLTQG